MCAMLAMIVSKELGIAPWRATFFLESYLGWVLPLLFYTSSRFRRAFGQAAVTCPSSYYTEAHTIGGDQVQCTGEAIDKLRWTNRLRKLLAS